MDENKIKAGRAKRIAITDELTEKLSRAKSVVVTDYRGLNMTQLQELRKNLLKSDAEFAVAKNTLFTRAAKEAGLDIAEKPTGPTAVLIAYGDEISPLKDLAAFIKTNKLPEIKGGFLGKESLSADRVLMLSKLPGRDELIGKVVGTVAAPLYGLVGALQGNIRNLVYTLDAIRNQKAQ